MRYIQVDESGRLIAVAEEGYHCGPGEMGVDIPEEFDKGDMRNWMLEGGALVRRALADDALEPDAEQTWDARLARAEAAAEKLEKLLEIMRETAALRGLVERLEADTKED